MQTNTAIQSSVCYCWDTYVTHTGEDQKASLYRRIGGLHPEAATSINMKWQQLPRLFTTGHPARSKFAP